MHFTRLLLVFQLFLAFLAAPFFVAPLLAQATDSDQSEEGTTSDRKPGMTVIVEATGSAEIIEAPGGAPKPAQKGQHIPEGAAIVTGPDGRIDLALSNGAFFQIQENSRFLIRDFEQDAYEFVFSNSDAISSQDVLNFGEDKAAMITLDASPEEWNKMPMEPGGSHSKFALDYGTLIGESKTLRQGSSMEISTPIGIAGIRGTIWRITVQRVVSPGSNTYRGTLDVPRGLVNFASIQGNRAVDVSGGYSMNIEVTFQGSQIIINSINISRMSSDRMTYIENISQQVQAKQTFFQAVPGTPDDVGITIDNAAEQLNDGANNEGDTGSPQVEAPAPTQINPGGGTGNLAPFIPKPRQTQTPTPTPAPTATPVPSNK